MSQLADWLARLVRTLARVVSAESVLVITALVGGLLVTGLVAGGAEIYDQVEDGNGLADFDRPVLDQALRLRTVSSARLVTGFTHLGGPVGMTIIATAVTVFMVLRWRSRTPAVLMLLAVAGSLAMTTVGKAVVGRARPPLIDAVPPYEYAFSFPSGHALNSTVISIMLVYLALPHLHARWARTLAVALAVVWSVTMGLSRVFLGHHWLTDVIFAWVTGLAWAMVLITAHRLLRSVRQRRRGPAPEELVAS